MNQSETAHPRRLDHRDYFRMPWTMTDNAMSWLEITTRCNIVCKGCYRDPKKDGHKSLEQIREELETFKRFRKSDGMSLAGGDPLIHPQIVEIVRMVREMGWKPLLNTNGQALTPELARELRDAGAASFTFHIDTTQTRSDGATNNEADCAALRLRYADMLAEAGGMTCGFNVTVTRPSLGDVPQIVRWAAERPERVHSVHFIPYRDFGVAPDFDLFIHGTPLEVDARDTHPEYLEPTPVNTQDVVDQIRTSDGGYEPAAYLGGTCDPEGLKWTFATRFLLQGQTLGYAGPRFMEIAQKWNHYREGTWMALTTPKMQASGRLLLFLFFLFDKAIRSTLWSYIKAVFRSPLNLFRRVRMQGFLVLQPSDIVEDGRFNMCDGCPDMTVHEGQLYWSCRLEEIKEYGAFVTASPKQRCLPLKTKKVPRKLSEESEPQALPTAASDSGDA